MHGQSPKEDLPESPFPAWAAPVLDNVFRRLLLTNPRKKVLESGVKEGDKVLELGCGPGFYTEALSNIVGPAGKVYAHDVQPEMIDRVKRKITEKNLANTITVLSSSARIPIETGSIDFIFAANVWEEIDKERITKETINELARICRPNGRLFIEDHKFGGGKPSIDRAITLMEEDGFSLELRGETWVSVYAKLRKR
jgi:ubiquinone/menaquinone biosynthesis C-methylase UbiE